MRSTAKVYNVLTATLLLSLTGLSACVLPDKDKTPQAAEKVGDASAPPQASIEAKQLAAEQEAAEVTEVSFKKGQSKLSKEAAQKLKQVREKIDNPGAIEKVVVVAWADQPYPSKKKESLSESALRLAEARGKSVAEFFTGSDKNDDLKVEIYNMAERPGTFEKFLSGSEARVKESLEISGVPTKTSKAMVLVVNKK